VEVEILGKKVPFDTAVARNIGPGSLALGWFTCWIDLDGAAGAFSSTVRRNR
jgi:hypothetical protein